jgi:hypothetical protein
MEGKRIGRPRNRMLDEVIVSTWEMKRMAEKRGEE